MEVVDNPNLRLQQLTVDAWVFPRSFDGDFDIFVARDSGIVGSKSRSWNFQANHPLAGSCFNKPAFSLFFGGGQNPFVCGTKQLPLGQWSHMAMTYDGNRIRLYINGEREGGATQQPLPGASLNAEATSLTIGSLDGRLFFFNGLVDEVEVFDRALSASEIQAIFNAGSAGKCKSPQPPGDTTPPETTFVSAIDGGGASVVDGESTQSSSITFTFSGTDDVGVVGFECSLDGAPLTACTSPQVFTGLALGSHTFQVRSEDGSGNVDTTPAAQSWTILAPDSTPPVVTVPADITAEATSASGAAVTFVASASDNIDGALPPTCAPASGSIFALGTTTVNCSATDATGNTGSSAFNVTVVDTTPPVVTITSAVDGNAAPVANGGSTLSRSITLTFTAIDNVAVAGIQCSLDGAAFTACTSPQGFTGLGVGGHVFEARATDSAGNTNLTPAGFAWTVLTPAEALQPIIDKIDGLLGDPDTPQKARKELEDARKKLVKALELLDEGKIKQAFKEIEKGLKKLLKAADAGVDVSECNLALVNIGRRMAQDALTEALQLPGDANEIAKALEEMAKAQEELDKGKPDKAIKHFSKAWDHAQKALDKA